MAAIAGTIVAAKITTGDTTNTHAITHCNETEGGVHSVADNTARDAITAPRRKEGMYCYTIDSENTYQLVGGVANGNWTLVSTGGATSNTYTAGENISAYVLVVQADASVWAADSSDTADIGKVVGITTESATATNSIKVQSIGIITNGGWSWTPNQKIYYTNTGTVTTTIPVTGFVQQIGVASSATTITLKLGVSIALA